MGSRSCEAISSTPPCTSKMNSTRSVIALFTSIIIICVVVCLQISRTQATPTSSLLLNNNNKLTSTSNCQLPPTWAGKWYQANKEPIRVTNTEISDKGVCRDQKGDKYLFEYVSSNPKQTSAPCLMCLVINERHLNVLQYKESTCQAIPQNYYNKTSNQLTIDQNHALLDTICSDITGDAQLESLFRLDTPPIECPISGQYSFTYDNCRDTQSSLDSCIDKKQLNFKFSACSDVPDSESKSEELKCYADWSEGNNYYMIGRLEHASNQLDKGKFRCIVYEKSPDGKYIQMAQSLEESCYGLINANEGPKTLRLALKPPTLRNCRFSSYIQNQSENWLSVDNSLIYMFNQNSTSYQVKETKEGNVIEEATCLQQFHLQTHQHPHAAYSSQQQVKNINFQQAITNRRYPQPLVSNQAQTDQSFQTTTASRHTTNDVVYLVQITKNWNAYSGVLPSTQIITSTNLEHQRCPFEGVYTIEAPVESDLSYNPSYIFLCPRQSFITAQCDHPSRLQIHSRCSPTKSFIKNLHCLGSWTTNGLVRLLLADDDRQRYSAWYRDYGALVAAQEANLESAGQAQALQSGNILTRSQQMLVASASDSNSINSPYLVSPTVSIPSIVDLQLALITPLPIIAKPMQVRLTRRNQCSELRGYRSLGSYSSPMSVVSSSNMPGYMSQATVSSSAAAASPVIASHSSIVLLLFVTTLLLSLLNRQHQHH